MQGDRHLLGGEEVVAHRHREREIQEQDGCAARQVLGLLDLEVVGLQPDREAARRPGTAATTATLGPAVRRRALRTVRSM